jgi:hypothetical protein
MKNPPVDIELPEDHVRGKADKVFVGGMRDPRDKAASSSGRLENHQRGPETGSRNATNRVARKLRKKDVSHSGRAGPPFPNRTMRLPTAYTLVLWEPLHVSRGLPPPANGMKKKPTLFGISGEGKIVEIIFLQVGFYD